MLGKKLVNQSLIYGLASLLINGSNFFLIPLYTHYLTTTEYGILASVTVLSTFTTAVLTLGLNGAVTRFYFEFEINAFRNFLFSVFIVQLVISFTAVAVVVIFNGIFIESLFNNVPYDPYLKYGLLIGFTGIFSSIPLAFLQAQSKAFIYRLFTSGSFLLLTAFMVFFIIVLKKGSLGAVTATLCANSIMAIIYCIYLLRESGTQFTLQFAKISLAFGLPLMVYVIFGTLMEISSKFFIERYISLAQLGIFNVAQQIAAVIVLITNAINMAWMPLFYAEAKKDERSTLFSMFGKFLIFALTLSGLSMAIFSDDLVLAFISPDYAAASLYIPYLVLAYIIGNGYWILLINPLTFSKKTIYMPFLTVVSGILSIILNILLVPIWGVMGAVVSICGSYFVLIVVTYFVFRRHSRVTYKFASMNLMLLFSVIIFLLSRFTFVENVWLVVIFKFALITLYCVALQLTRIYSVADLKLFFKAQSNQV